MRRPCAHCAADVCVYYLTLACTHSPTFRLLPTPQHDALPVIVAVPEQKTKEDFLLAYSCMPAALTEIAQIKDKKVVPEPEPET